MRVARTTAVMLLALCFAAPARGTTPTPAARRDRVTLGGVNSISADRPVRLPVRIPSTARVAFEFGRNRDLRVDGSGRFAGIVLTKAPRIFQDETLIGGVFRRCGRPGCTGRATRLTLPMNMRAGADIVLPPGDYVLYVITDGDPVEVRLLLRGLEGSRTLRPSIPADLEISTLPVVAGGPPPAPLQVSGATVDLPDAAMVLDALWFEGNPSGVTDIGTCLYEGVPPVADELAYSTACGELGAKERGGTGLSASTWFAELLLVFDVPLPAGTWSAGTHLSCTCVLSDSGTWRLVLRR